MAESGRSGEDEGATCEQPPPRTSDVGSKETYKPALQLVPSGPDHVEDTVYSLLLSSAYRAQTRILAVSPYFVPDDALLSAWCLACRRGVRLTLLIPRRSNHPLADLARERALRQMVLAGATVLLYPR